MQCVALHDWLLSLSLMFSRVIHVLTCISTSCLFNGWIVFQCMNIPHCSSIHHLMAIWITSTLLWVMLLWTLGEVVCRCIFLVFLGGIVGSYDNCLRKWQYYFTFPPAVYEVSSFFTDLSALVILWPFDCRHYNGYETMMSVILSVIRVYLKNLSLTVVFLWWVMILSIFSCAYWPFVPLFLRNICSDPLPIEKLGYLTLNWESSSYIQTQVLYHVYGSHSSL